MIKASARQPSAWLQGKTQPALEEKDEQKWWATWTIERSPVPLGARAHHAVGVDDVLGGLSVVERLVGGHRLVQRDDLHVQQLQQTNRKQNKAK